MRIIHCADLHIDSKLTSNFNSAKAKELKKELILAFENMIDYANDNHIKAIIIAGDMFDNTHVTKASKDRIFNLIKTNPNIDFLYLSGNHDESSILESLDFSFDNLKIFKDKWTSFRYDNVVITGVKLESNNNSIYDLLDLKKEDLNIVVMHGPIYKHNIKENSDSIYLNKLKNKNINYLALGHFHSYQEDKLDNNSVYCYSGCLCGRGFDECGPKGFVVLNIENDKINHQFVNFSKRMFHEIELDITGKDNWFDIEKETLENIKPIPDNDLIKLVLKGKYHINLIKQIDILESKLNALKYFVKIEDKSNLEINSSDYEHDPSLRGEFIRLVKKSSDLNEEDKDYIICTGLKALDGENLK